jgi:cytochrome c oxidase assembly factor CtaG
MRDLSRIIALAAGGLLALAMVLPPVSSLASQLFSLHMARHLLIVAVAAPLLVLGGVALRLPPAPAWCLFVGLFLFWHWPVAFGFSARHGRRCWNWAACWRRPSRSGAWRWAKAGFMTARGRFM